MRENRLPVFVMISFLVSVMVCVPVAGFFGCAVAGGAEVDISQLYVRQDTWSQTLSSSRQGYLAWWQQQHKGLELEPWYVRAKTGGGQKDLFIKQIDVSETDGKGVPMWNKRLDLIDAVVHQDLANDSEPILYHLRLITAEKPMKVTAWLGAQVGLDVWLNGKSVLSDPKMGNNFYTEANQAKVQLSLRKGLNKLVMKTHGARWGGLYFSLLSPDKASPSRLDAVLAKMGQDFPVETARMLADIRKGHIATWFRYANEVDLPRLLARRAITGLNSHNSALQDELRRAISAETRGSGRECLELYATASKLRKAWHELENVNFRALKMAIADLTKTFSDDYAGSAKYLQQAKGWEKRMAGIEKSLEAAKPTAIRQAGELAAFQRLALLSNPLLDFDDLMLIKRRPHDDPRRSTAHRGLGNYTGLPQQSSFQLHRTRQRFGWENEIVRLAMADLSAEPKTIYSPSTPKLISGINLHFGGDRMLFGMPGMHNRWQVFEVGSNGGNLRQVSLGDQTDVDNFDACYLPNGKIVFISTACFQGVPCNASVPVAMSYLMDGDGRNVRQLTFEQDHNYYPTMMNDGRVIYLRWEYTDIPHVWGRYLFTMNPDGTGQRALYGSGGYWPNSMFYAKPIPDHPTKIVCIFTGHHIGREGELMVLDPALGRKSAEGVIQQIPGYGKKPVPRVQDKYTEFSWPKFTHPWPLSENYFIVSCKPRPEDLWGIYLVDTFDNMILLKEIEGHALFEPIPLRKTKTPPVIADRVDLSRQDALMYIEDIYAGPGLKGVPKGSVKQIRLYTYHFAYDKTVGISSRVGTNGPWEPKRIIGTVPVEEDGSAFFRVPANTPLSLQPLDSEGKAMQLMRSWTTAQPGEMVSCTGCHENQNTVALNRSTIASRLQPAEIKPWRGPVRGFGFKYEVQPVLDKYCVGCHNGSKKTIARGMPDLRDEVEQDRFVVYKRGTPEVETIEGVSKAELLKKYPGVFDPAFIALRGYVRVGGLESDLRQQNACEFHADTSELIQMLKKGHHGVELDDEAWDRLVTWIDLNATCHATWRETAGMERISKDHQRRRDLRLLYAGLDDDPETIPQSIAEKVEFVKPKHGHRAKPKLVHVANWPFDAGEAIRKQTAAGPVNRSVDLGNGVTMEMVRIPAGQFVMGDLHGNSDEQPLAPVKVEKAFWMSKFEVTNEQYARFDSSHDSRYEHAGSMIFSEYDLGPLMNKPAQPVVRTSWSHAMAFCRWLSETSGQEFTLPTEAQWEYACRAGTSSPMSFGNLDTDFSSFANMADQSIRELAHRGRHDVPDLIPRDDRFDDGHLVTAYVGSYKPNPWGLCDMHGNVWEWTRSAYMEYPYDGGDGRNDIDEVGERVIRGGSWNDRPKRCRSAFRLSYPGWQQVYNVGFRVIMEAGGAGSMVAQTK